MDGTYSFDADGVATAITAPQWSRDALDSVQTTLAHLQKVLANPGIRDEVAEEFGLETEGKLLAQDDPLAGAIAEKIQGKPRVEKLALVRKIIDYVNSLRGLARTAEWAHENVLPWIEQLLNL
ncbi:hypothetical protein ACFSM7_13570 [Clavibacter michiganensis subsp. tessellarius]